jgi:hypothetical protein
LRGALTASRISRGIRRSTALNRSGQLSVIVQTRLPALSIKV